MCLIIDNFNIAIAYLIKLLNLGVIYIQKCDMRKYFFSD